MSKLLIFLFFLDFFIFMCVLIYFLIFNILIMKNKNIIKDFFYKNGYKLYWYENMDGKVLSRKSRINFVYQIIISNNSIINQHLFIKVMKLWPFIRIIIGCGIFIFILLVGLLFPPLIPTNTN